jgi:hypothetical protein
MCLLCGHWLALFGLVLLFLVFFFWLIASLVFHLLDTSLGIPRMRHFVLERKGVWHTYPWIRALHGMAGWRLGFRCVWGTGGGPWWLVYTWGLELDGGLLVCS